MRKLTETWKNKRERGVALVFAIFTLLLVSAIAATLVFMTNTETSVNSNYRAERVSSFAAKAGMEEIRDRMALPPTDPKSLANLLPGLVPGVPNPNPGPGVYPPAANSVLYVVNEGAAAAGTVQPWSAGNAYMDDELCHDFAGVQAQQPPSDVRCTTPPTAPMLVAGAPFTSTYPWAGTKAALTYKWIRVTLKQSGSNQNYPVNGAFPGTQVCWNGSNEILVNAPDLICQDNIDPTSLTVPPAIKSATPVYMITALAVSSTGSTRRMVQAEVAQAPAQPFNYGVYATSTACPAINFHGGGNGNPATDSYSSKNGSYSNNNSFNTGGNVGAIGGVSLSGHAQIGGNVGVQSLPGAAQQVPCAGGDYVTTGNAGIYNPNGNGNNNPNPNQIVQLSQPPPTFPTPPDPSPLPTANSPQPTNPAVPGTYGAISVNGQLTLAPGVYNIYSLNIGGGSGSIVISPPGAVVLNFPSGSASPISISGQGLLNDNTAANPIPNNMQINYGGTGTISITGQGNSYAIVDAPNAAIAVAGNGEFFGRIVGGTIDYGGNGKFHFDTASALRPANNTNFQLISYREITY
ncbi:MAG TPA: pilus assembly PilX N-terminal domain-containing protein [Candidatus Acidoferrales bacterium]|nr:pilus assembly PilX N-terminal domain-containing protein [Candidatus Acidoferrales bacterium]